MNSLNPKKILGWKIMTMGSGPHVGSSRAADPPIIHGVFMLAPKLVAQVDWLTQITLVFNSPEFGSISVPFF